MLFTTKWITGLFTEFSGRAEEEVAIDEVTSDSRVKTENGLFVPIIGENFDGHDYVKQAIDNGAVAIMWGKGKSLPAFISPDLPVFYVENTLTALQHLAAGYRDEINPIVVGITGSNGKTTTKDMVAALVKTTYRTHYTKGNFNNHIGLPLTILSMNRNTEMLVLEMGMSNFGEIDLLSRLAKPDYAIITNIGESHIEFLGSRRGIANAKLEITNGLKENGIIIIDGDEDLLMELHKQDNVITCGYNPANDIAIEQVEIELKQTRFKLSGDNVYTIPLLGRHHALNATYAIALADKLAIIPDKRRRALESLEHTSMRFELQKGINDVSIINDAYNASPTSMKAAIEVVKQMEGFKQRILILGDILELGEHSESMHRSVAAKIEHPVTAVFTFGEAAAHIASTVKKKNATINSKHFTTRKELAHELENHLNKDTLLMFKASRGLHFESFIKEIISS
ncbi:UDP-N-acetylmuramoyl-tripeptide--D-alanyl-D-alanine ligase [Virgibacillus sp. C22-A2]|uniref:UDP-N-acetylmuramoyl-tripeptide--D-alanyl-D-alanine ligase n=1 Tax=Virgibacillus tibetensis TaxID=3042313 RepID=A0ABU6KCJ5_9BACI|nr:UDP-N-acetylmuramoyl-tripeptide--D-alanyl-D-alanine ligase [Virgibacillus sp. C22-A2]